MKRFLPLFVVLALLPATVFAEKIDLGSGKTLFVTLPSTWTGTELPAQPADLPEIGRSVRYATKSGSNDAVLMTILPVPDNRLSERDELKALAESSAQQFVPGSVEGKVDLKELKFGGVTGFAVSFTDARLVGKPSIKEDYKAMTACYIYLGENILVTATLYTDEMNGKAYAEGMRILKSMSLQLPKDTI